MRHHDARDGKVRERGVHRALGIHVEVRCALVEDQDAGATDSGPLRPAIPRWASATGSDMDFGQFVVKAAAGVPRWTSASLARAR
jgi:hypothetical protein